jgi:hypothetical protein
MKTTKESEDDQMLDDEDTVETGEPGGGRGRVDETGHSGVWPGSGPWPAGDTPLVPPAGWGQGARGAAEYENHGDSETHVPGAIGGEEPPETKVSLMQTQEVPVHEWPVFFENFTRRYAGEMVTVEICSLEESEEHTEVLAENLPLAGLDGEFRDGMPVSIQVMIGTEPEVHVTHTIVNPAYIWRYRDESGNDVMTEIEAVSGELTTIHL